MIYQSTIYIYNLSRFKAKRKNFRVIIIPISTHIPIFHQMPLPCEVTSFFTSSLPLTITTASTHSESFSATLLSAVSNLFLSFFLSTTLFTTVTIPPCVVSTGTKVIVCFICSSTVCESVSVRLKNSTALFPYAIEKHESLSASLLLFIVSFPVLHPESSTVISKATHHTHSISLSIFLMTLL